MRFSGKIGNQPTNQRTTRNYQAWPQLTLRTVTWPRAIASTSEPESTWMKIGTSELITLLNFQSFQHFKNVIYIDLKPSLQFQYIEAFNHGSFHIFRNYFEFLNFCEF